MGVNNTEETTPARSDRKRSSYVSEFLDSERKKARTCLSMQDDKHIEDLEYMLKSVRALIKIIQEIWDNCEHHLSSWEENKSSFTFEREIFEEAKVEKKGRHLKITTQKVSKSKDFGSLPAVPENLIDIMSVSQTESDILPDYNRYLDKCALLCENVLLPFLTTFQEHLKRVQVYLGEIEEWLLEPRVVNSFLKTLFDIQLDDVEVGDVKKLYKSYCLDVDSKMESKFNICTEVGREGLEAALAFTKFYNPVTQIEVKDAGVEAINGRYRISGVTHDDVYVYTRSGVWNGKPAKFYLRRNVEDEWRWWNLFCEYKSQMDSLVEFYWTDATGEENELPPMGGWKWSTEGNGESAYIGIDPPPQIVYKIDD